MPEHPPCVPARVFLDGYNMALTEGTGVATYGRNLSLALGRLGYRVGVLFGTRAARPRDPLLREVTFFDERPRRREPDWVWGLRHARRLATAPLGDSAQHIPVTGQVVATGFRDRLPHFDELWNARDLFGYARTHFDLFGTRRLARVAPAPALMHWSYPLPLRLRGARNIYTLHDLVPLRLPYTTGDDKRRYLRLVRHLADAADHIVTVSEASRRDIISLLGVPAERVTNTYQAVATPLEYAALPLAAAQAEIRHTYGLEAGEFLLFVGAIEPKKNLARLIRAHAASGVPRTLVIAGKPAWRAGEELAELLPGGTRSFAPHDAPPLPLHAAGQRVMVLGHVPQRLLVGLLRSARALLFPSLYEGFGLPALEAMQLGTPVVTSNTGSMPEVVGNAAILIDPYDIGALASAIRAVDADAGLRARLAAAGLRQAARFTPEAYAARLGEVYARLGVPPPEAASPDGADR